MRDDITFTYVAKEGKHREITVTDGAIRPTVRALAGSGNGLDALFSWQDGDTWRALHSHDVSNYIAAHAGAHFTAKEFRTWNATVLMALLLANAAPAPDPGAGGTSSRPASAAWPAGWATPRPWRGPPTSTPD